MRRGTARAGRFERQITPGCLTCHANQVEHVEGTEGRYRPPMFRGHAIGCERCHGPGELHVAQPHDVADGPNIVNPRKLTPVLREDVCQQCHLLGQKTIDRRGHQLADYRPGLSLAEFVTVFSRPSNRQEGHTNGDHVEQMSRSRCFRAVMARWVASRATTRTGCRLKNRRWPITKRDASPVTPIAAVHCPRWIGRNAGMNTTALLATCRRCRRPTSAISRRPCIAFRATANCASAQAAAGAKQPIAGTLLVPFHRDQMSPSRLVDADRDLGVALRHDGRRGATKALPLLSRASGSSR